MVSRDVDLIVDLQHTIMKNIPYKSNLWCFGPEQETFDPMGTITR